MRVIAVTGGIATGKSMAGAILRALVPRAAFFDADEAVARLHADSVVREEIRARFGARAIAADGAPDRRVLREIVFGDESARRALEAILHPRVRRDCLASRDRAAKSGASPLFVADIPLLFESEFDWGHELAVVVAATPTTQARRLQRRNGFDDATIRSILGAQLAIAEKIRRADLVVWNEGSPAVLRWQVQRLVQSLIPA